jgi:hypothetical protein
MFQRNEPINARIGLVPSPHRRLHLAVAIHTHSLAPFLSFPTVVTAAAGRPPVCTTMRSCLLRVLAFALPLLCTCASPFSRLFAKRRNVNAPTVAPAAADRLAARDSNADVALDSASSFVTSFGGVAQNFTFSLTVNLNGDLWFRLAGPAWWSWLAVGTGTEMAGSLMFIVYRNAGNSALPRRPRR